MDLRHRVVAAFVTGAFLLSGTVLGAVSPVLASETVPPESMPDVEISMGDETGTIFDVEFGAGVELQLTPIGPDTGLIIYNRPAWLVYDWTKQTITGTAPADVSEYKISVIARNSHAATGKTIVLNVKPAGHIVEQHVSLDPGRQETVTMSCPASHPRVKTTIPGNILGGFSHVGEDRNVTFWGQKYNVNAKSESTGVTVVVSNSDNWRHLWSNLTLYCTAK